MRSRTCSVLIALHILACSSSDNPSTGAAKSDAAAADASTKPAAKSDAAVSGGSGSKDKDAGAGGSGGNAGHAGGDPASLKQTCIGTKPLSDAYVADPKLCAFVFAEDLGAARQLAFAPNGDLFVNNGDVIVLWDEDGDGYSSASERKTFGEAQGLNHGIAFSRDNKFVYVSSGTTVYRFAYKSGQRSADAAPEVVIKGIPTGGHSTRTLAFDSKGLLYVSIGSAGNVDTTPKDIEVRSQIRRYQLPETLPQGGITYPGSGELVASGMRNEAGIFIDEQDRLWGVENGRDNLNDADLGGDIHNDNPGEEINLVDGQGSKFYGYPSCFSEHTLNAGKGQGTQWADESLSGDLLKTDEFCSDSAEVHPPAYVMPAHWAPLGIIVYSGRTLPYTGELIIGAHGSWNRSPATGRVVVRARLQGSTVSDLQVILGQKGSGGAVQQGKWDVRPVDVRQGPDDAVYISDDLGGRVIKLGYRAGG
jgi:glucose/arabinose dehydrogenase